MRLIYAYAKKYRNFEDQEFTLTNSYKVQPLRKGEGLSGLRITRVDDAFRQDMPPNILSISALVGRNATGKTNFAEMLGAKRGQLGFGGEEQTDAYFLLYASNQRENDLYFFEVVSPVRFGELFSWMEEAAESPCAAGWCRYDSDVEHLSAVGPEALHAEKSVMISLCDHLRGYDMAAKYGLPVKRRSGKYLANTFTSQVRVVQKLYRSKDLTVLRDPKYRLELICDMRYLAHGPEGTPEKDTPLFPTLYDKAELSERQRKAVRLAEGWIKFLAGSQIDDFDTWLSLRQCIAWRANDLLAGTAFDDDFSRSQQLLRHYLSDVIVFLKSNFLLSNSQEWVQYQLERFLELIMTSQALELTESSIIIPVAAVEEGGGTGNTAQELTRDLVDGILGQNAGFGRFIRPVWEDVSDGELWYIHFFAAISEVLEDAARAERPDTCILILDEPEIHMHPDLARQLLDHLTRWLEDYCKDIKIQIILTTHSPFILSDVEKGNVQILRRSQNDADANAERLTKVASPQKQTYAANIYTLLTDSFFLDSGFGELARRQIRRVFNELESENDIDSMQKAYMDRVICNIGERLIRNQLNEKLRTKFGAHAGNGSKGAGG